MIHPDRPLEASSPAGYGMSVSFRRLTQALLLLSLVGCSTQHYLVTEETPLFAGPTGERVVAKVPRYHHDVLSEEADPSAARVPVVFQGKAGYAKRSALRIFSYLSPAIDDGEDRGETIGRELRELQLAHIGKAWPTHLREAIRDQQVLRGMTARMVEVAWGWPSTVEAGASAGAVRWVYRHDDVEVVQKFVGDPWSASGLYAPDAAFGWRGIGGGHWRYGLNNGYASIRFPVTEERTVHLDAKGRVSRVTVRRYLKS